MAQAESIQSVARSFALLEKLAETGEGASIKQLTEEMSLPKSTVHRLLKNLIQLGYVAQTDTGLYRGTLKTFEVGSSMVGKIDVVAAARPYLNALASRVGQTVHLVVRDGIEAVYVFKAEGEGLQMSSRLGLRMPLYCTGVGKAILSGLPYEEVRQIWKMSSPRVVTPKTVRNFDELAQELSQTKRRGWAIDDEENEPGIRCVAVSLPSPSGPEAAFSVTGPAAVMTDERIQELAGLCLETKKEISVGLGLSYPGF